MKSGWQQGLLTREEHTAKFGEADDARNDSNCTSSHFPSKEISTITHLPFIKARSRRMSIPVKKGTLPHGTLVRPMPFRASSFDHSRRMCFCTFPLAVFGISSGTPSSPRNHTHAGEF